MVSGAVARGAECTCLLCIATPSGEQLLHAGSLIRKASLFSRGRKRDSEEIILLKMADLGGGQHPVRAVRSKQLTRRAFWADPTIHYLGQVAVESREGIEELTIDQARILGGPDRRPAQGENVDFFLSEINL